MSTYASPSAEPSPAPVPVAPRPALPKPRDPQRQRIWIAAGLLALTGAAAYTWFNTRTAQPKPAAAVTIRTARVAVGRLEQTIRVAGSTAAARFVNIAAPLMRGPDAGRGLTLVYLAENGKLVKKGTLVGQIDTTAAKDHVDDVKAQLVQSESDIRKRKADQAIEEETLRQDIRTAKAALDKARLDAGAAEIRTPIDAEQLKLTVEENEAAYAEVQKDFDINLESHRSELRLLELTRIRNERHLERHAGDLKKFTILSPLDGLVVMLSIWRGGDAAQIRNGDQLAPNQSFMRIVDPQTMRLEANVNQVESESLHIGQEAVVHFDAFPDLHLKGKVYSIGALAVGGWRQNYFIRNVPVKIAFAEQNPLVIPDLSACADVVVAAKDNALVVPIEAIRYEGGKPVVRVRQGDQFVSRPVELGLTNHTHAAVLAGLSEGQEVALNDAPVAPQLNSKAGTGSNFAAFAKLRAYTRLAL